MGFSLFELLATHAGEVALLRMM